MSGPTRQVRGCPVLIEPASDVPLVWVQVAVRGGAASDPAGTAGATRHMAELARRGAGSRDRAALDRALDQLGAALNVSTARDWFAINLLCLSRHLDAALDLLGDVLAAPRMEMDEHRRLQREAEFALDELRDDDGALLARFFQREIGQDHPYGRSQLGTRASIAALDLAAARDRYRAAVVPRNLVIGFAGDVEEAAAVRAAERLLGALPDQTPPAPPDVTADIATPPRRRTLLVDKPERTQAQIAIGCGAPRYGTEAFDALVLVETIFGGTFSSRLMQEIRVRRGWSYGAGCALGRAVGPLWLRIDLSPAADVAPEALGLTLRLFEDLVNRGVTEAEIDFCKGHLHGSWAFSRATARSRLRLRLRAALSGLGQSFVDRWPDRIAAVTRDSANAAARAHLTPDRTTAAVVCTADDMLPRLRTALSEATLGDLDVTPHDSY